MLKLLGYEGWISTDNLWQTRSIVNGSMPSFDLWLYGFAGGIFQCLVYYSLSLMSRDENRAVYKTVALQGLIYAFFEAYDFAMEGALISILASAIYLIYWMLIVQVEQEPHLNST